MQPASATCRFAMPAIGCDRPEMFFLTIFFLVLAVISSVATYRTVRNRCSEGIWVLATSFWVPMGTWSIFRCVTFTIPFRYSVADAAVVLKVVNSELFLIPMSVGVFIFYRCLTLFQNPRAGHFTFFRLEFGIFLSVYLIIGTVVCIANHNDPAELDRSMGMWLAATDLIIVIFASVPSPRLFRSISFAAKMMTGNFMRFVNVGVAVFVLIYSFRLAFDGCAAFARNPVADFIYTERPHGGNRTAALFCELILEGFAAALMMAAVWVLQKAESSLVARVISIKETSDRSVLEWTLSSEG
jgi:hypothetical protein